MIKKMVKKGNFFAYILLFALLLPALLLGQSIGKEINLKWGPVENASGYQVEVVDEKEKAIVKKRTKSNSLPVKLKPGKYQFRIGVLNKFSKIAVFSDWVDLDVKKPVTPVISSISPDSVTQKNKNQRIVIKGENLFKSTQIHLTFNQRKIPIKKMELIGSDTIELIVDTTSAPPGKYSVSLLNPGNKSSVKRNAFSINTLIEKAIGPSSHGRYVSLGLMPQIFYFEIQKLNSIFQTNRAISLDIFLNHFERYFITPAVRIGYLSSESSKEPNITLKGFRTDVFLSINFFTGFGFEISSNVGTGVSFMDLESSYNRTGGQQESFRSLNLFISLETKYQVFQFLSLNAGVEYLSLVDPGGKISFFTPRLGLTLEF